MPFLVHDTEIKIPLEDISRLDDSTNFFVMNKKSFLDKKAPRTSPSLLQKLIHDFGFRRNKIVVLRTI